MCEALQPVQKLQGPAISQACHLARAGFCILFGSLLNSWMIMDVQLIVGCVSIACPYSCRWPTVSCINGCLSDRSLWDTVGQFHVSVDSSTRASSLKVERQDRRWQKPGAPRSSRQHPFQDMNGNRMEQKDHAKHGAAWHLGTPRWGLYIQRASTSQDWVRPAAPREGKMSRRCACQGPWIFTKLGGHVRLGIWLIENLASVRRACQREHGKRQKLLVVDLICHCTFDSNIM